MDLDSFLAKVSSTYNRQDLLPHLQTLHSALTSPSHPSSPSLSPKSFFIAFHGTITLAFAGWPSSISQAKAKVDAQLVPHALQGENMGTKWPKVTLGSLKEGFAMEKSEARRLLDVVERVSREVVAGNTETEVLDDLQLVLYQKRSLENPRLSTCQVPFANVQPNNASQEPLDPQSVSYVDKILKESDDFETYFPHMNNDSRRISFYKEPCQPELTMVHFLKSNRILQIISQFKAQIDKEFPGWYVWMPEDALHVSVRALNFTTGTLS